MVTLTSVGKPTSCCQKGGTDLAGIVVNITLHIPLNSNQETQLVTKGTIDTLNASVDPSDLVGPNMCLESGISPECILGHIQLKERNTLVNEKH